MTNDNQAKWGNLTYLEEIDRVNRELKELDKMALILNQENAMHRKMEELTGEM